ncbi:MAG: IclR family transcriptional regulator [Deltaproteobacteria bacterium]|nr:IclR family transcriptional regulator [Deltaproteobacteria bacterium]
MVKSANRVLQILEAVAFSHGGMRHAEIAADLQIPKGSLSLLLADLVKSEYLFFRRDDKRYLLGPQVLLLASHYITHHNIIEVSRPILSDLVILTGESAEIALRRGNEIIIVARELSLRSLSSCMQIGERAPLYATASGKAILAHLAPAESEAYLATGPLPSLTRHTVTDPIALRRELEGIRNGGIAYSREEHSEGIIAMAAPVFGLGGQVEGSLTVPMPSIRFNRKKEKEVEQILRAASRRISHQLGCPPVLVEAGKRGQPEPAPWPRAAEQERI